MLGVSRQTVIPVHFDPQYAVFIQLESVSSSSAALQLGHQVVFAIHSPTRLFIEETTNVIGHRYDFSIVKDPESHFSALEVVRPIK